jgi:protein-glutamine gamma-glutamyltransferase
MYLASIERYLDTSLVLLLATGFVTLASTGRLDAISLLLVGGALLLRGYLLVRGIKFDISDRALTFLTFGFAAFYILDFTIVSGSFIPATVHLVLFSMVVKLFSVRRDRDRLYLAILAFLAVLAAAVLTVDTVFLVSFCLFLLLAVCSFVAFEMKRAATRAHSARPSTTARALARPLSKAGLVLLILIVAVGSVLFFLLPRLSTGYLSAYAPRNELVSGFSESVRLGQIGEIKQTDSVVMHVQIEGDTTGAYDLKWRGIALDTFDGRNWKNTQDAYIMQPAADSSFDLRGLNRVPTRQPRIIRYRVLMEPIGANVFFLAPVALQLAGPYKGVSINESAAVFNAFSERQITEYRGVSDISQPPAGSVRVASGEVPLQADRYLQLPNVDPEIMRLATRVTANAPSSFDKAAALEQYLFTNYQYSLRQQRTPGVDPISDFLFNRKQGHCEYFASAMALMLRTIGIPSRVVNGFRGGEFNSLTGSYVIRAREAHSWVEAYFPSQGWISFDPTPPDPKPAAGAWNRAQMYVDAMREFWREWIVNYDSAHQTELAASTTAQGRQLYQRAVEWAKSRYEAMLARARKVQARGSADPRRTFLLAICVAGLACFGFSLPRMIRAARERRLVRNPQQAPQAAASLWYGRMSRSLERYGYRKAAAQTPAEFVGVINDPCLRAKVAEFTSCYERARFGCSTDDACALPQLFEQIQRVQA